jgi:hypothetical protein
MRIVTPALAGGTCTALCSQHLRFWTGVVQCRCARVASEATLVPALAVAAVQVRNLFSIILRGLLRTSGFFQEW